MKQEDTPRHRGMRRKLVEVIRSKGITDQEVLKALDNVPRHFFAFEDSVFIERAYEDTAFPIGEGQTISQPFTVAYQTQLLEVKRGEKILEIGTGSGYQSAILAEVGARVFTIERVKKLFVKTKQLFEDIGYKHIKCFYGDGFEGLPTFAPFDKILVTAGAPDVPQKLLDQLRTGGALVIPIGVNDLQIMKRYSKISSLEIREEAFDTFRFVPMLPGKKS